MGIEFVFVAVFFVAVVTFYAPFVHAPFFNVPFVYAPFVHAPFLHTSLFMFISMFFLIFTSVLFASCNHQVRRLCSSHQRLSVVTLLLRVTCSVPRIILPRHVFCRFI